MTFASLPSAPTASARNGAQKSTGPGEGLPGKPPDDGGKGEVPHGGRQSKRRFTIESSRPDLLSHKRCVRTAADQKP
jgi:hypothetical protein